MIDGGRGEDELEIVNEGRGEVNRLRPMVGLTEVRLIVPMSGLALVAEGVTVEAPGRTVPKRGEDGRPSPRTLSFLPIVG